MRRSDWCAQHTNLHANIGLFFFTEKKTSKTKLEEPFLYAIIEISAIICFNIFTASFFISKIWPVLRLRLFQPRFHVNSDEETPALILSIFWSFTHPNVFFSIIRKYMISLLAHKMKSLNKTFTLVSAGFETCQDRQRRLLLDEKVVMWQSRDMLSYHVNTQIVGRYMIIIFSEGFGALQWKKMKFEVNFCLSLVSMLSAISWYKAPFISLAVPQFGTT